MNKLVETPLDDTSRSLYSSRVHEQHSIAQLNFIIAKLSSFILKKPIQFFSATTKNPDESVLFNWSLHPLQLIFHFHLSFNNHLLHMYYKLSVVMFALFLFLVQSTNLSLKI